MDKINKVCNKIYKVNTPFCFGFSVYRRLQ